MAESLPSHSPGNSARRKRRTLLLLAVVIISLLIFAYPVARFNSWAQLPVWLNAVITFMAFGSQIFARVLLRNRTSEIAHKLRMAADFLLGVAPVMLVLVLICELAIATSLISKANAAIAVGIGTLAAAIIGLIKAWHPQTVQVDLTTEKVQQPLRFAQISDVHIGSRTPRFLKKIMRQIIDLEVDFLCITGDFIDQYGIERRHLEPLTWFQGPIYFCIGNHERYEDLEQIIERLESLGVHVLRNRSIDGHGLQIIGIDDSEDPDQVAKQLNSIDVDKNRYSILLYHRPHGLEDAADAGINLKLSGHTHNGQIVPFNFAVNKVFQYRKGLYQHNETHLYVNEGTGTWGPTMRLGTSSEITLFSLTPSPQV